MNKCLYWPLLGAFVNVLVFALQLDVVAADWHIFYEAPYDSTSRMKAEPGAKDLIDIDSIDRSASSALANTMHLTANSGVASKSTVHANCILPIITELTQNLGSGLSLTSILYRQDNGEWWHESDVLAGGRDVSLSELMGKAYYTNRDVKMEALFSIMCKSI